MVTKRTYLKQVKAGGDFPISGFPHTVTDLVAWVCVSGGVGGVEVFGSV